MHVTVHHPEHLHRLRALPFWHPSAWPRHVIGKDTDGEKGRHSTERPH